MLWLILVVVVLVVLATWTTWTAMRIDRLAARCDAAWQSLDAQLARRGAALVDVAAGLPEHDRVTVQAAVRTALGSPRETRADAENAVSALIEEHAAAHPTALAEPCSRVQVARTFYNDAVRASSALRAQRLPRALGLGRAHPVPPFFDIDDDPGIPA